MDKRNISGSNEESQNIPDNISVSSGEASRKSDEELQNTSDNMSVASGEASRKSDEELQNTSDNMSVASGEASRKSDEELQNTSDNMSVASGEASRKSDEELQNTSDNMSVASGEVISSTPNKNTMRERNVFDFSAIYNKSLGLDDLYKDSYLSSCDTIGNFKPVISYKDFILDETGFNIVKESIKNRRTNEEISLENIYSYDINYIRKLILFVNENNVNRKITCKSNKRKIFLDCWGEIYSLSMSPDSYTIISFNNTSNIETDLQGISINYKYYISNTDYLVLDSSLENIINNNNIAKIIESILRQAKTAHGLSEIHSCVSKISEIVKNIEKSDVFIKGIFRKIITNDSELDKTELNNLIRLMILIEKTRSLGGKEYIINIWDFDIDELLKCVDMDLFNELLIKKRKSKNSEYFIEDSIVENIFDKAIENKYNKIYNFLILNNERSSMVKKIENYFIKFSIIDSDNELIDSLLNSKINGSYIIDSIHILNKVKVLLKERNFISIEKIINLERDNEYLIDLIDLGDIFNDQSKELLNLLIKLKRGDEYIIDAIVLNNINKGYEGLCQLKRENKFIIDNIICKMINNEDARIKELFECLILKIKDKSIIYDVIDRTFLKNPIFGKKDYIVEFFKSLKIDGKCIIDDVIKINFIKAIRGDNQESIKNIMKLELKDQGSLINDMLFHMIEEKDYNNIGKLINLKENNETLLTSKMVISGIEKIINNEEELDKIMLNKLLEIKKTDDTFLKKVELLFKNTSLSNNKKLVDPLIEIKIDGEFIIKNECINGLLKEIMIKGHKEVFEDFIKLKRSNEYVVNEVLYQELFIYTGKVNRKDILDTMLKNRQEHIKDDTKRRALEEAKRHGCKHNIIDSLTQLISKDSGSESSPETKKIRLDQKNLTRLINDSTSFENITTSSENITTSSLPENLSGTREQKTDFFPLSGSK